MNLSEPPSSSETENFGYDEKILHQRLVDQDGESDPVVEYMNESEKLTNVRFTSPNDAVKLGEAQIELELLKEQHPWETIVTNYLRRSYFLQDFFDGDIPKSIPRSVPLEEQRVYESILEMVDVGNVDGARALAIANISSDELIGGLDEIFTAYYIENNPTNE